VFSLFVLSPPRFFSTGFFYSQGLEVADGTYRLRQELNVPYHHPLPPQHTRPDGLYPLAADMADQGILGRYFSRMDFANRPKDFLRLVSRVTAVERATGFDLVFDIKGPPGIPVTIELSFREGGTFSSGLDTTDEPTAFVLKSGYASYTREGDTLRFGPGFYRKAPLPLEGESITWLSGAMPSDGLRVYLTAETPFQHTLEFR